MVKERHELILVVTGSVFEREERAYWLVKELSWILPTVILCGGLVDLLLSFIYMKFYHPWKDILSSKKKPKKKKSFKKASQNRFEDVENGVQGNETKALLQDQKQDQNDKIR